MGSVGRGGEATWLGNLFYDDNCIYFSLVRKKISGVCRVLKFPKHTLTRSTPTEAWNNARLCRCVSVGKSGYDDTQGNLRAPGGAARENWTSSLLSTTLDFITTGEFLTKQKLFLLALNRPLLLHCRLCLNR